MKSIIHKVNHLSNILGVVEVHHISIETLEIVIIHYYYFVHVQVEVLYGCRKIEVHNIKMRKQDLGMDKIVDEVGLDGINNIEIIENNVYNDEVNYIKVLDVDV